MMKLLPIGKLFYQNPEGRIIEGSKKDNFWEMEKQAHVAPVRRSTLTSVMIKREKKFPGKILSIKGIPSN